MTTLWLDTETYNDKKSIKAGTYEYARTCDVLLFAYALDNEDPKVWDNACGEAMPSRLLSGLEDPNTTLVAHHATFDRNVIRFALGIDTDIDRWECTMAKARLHGFPGALKDVGEILGLPQDLAKNSEGRKLINRFCKAAPKNHKAKRYDALSHPDEWERFVRYAAQDITAMRAIDQLLPDWNWEPDIEIFRLDQRINDRGFAVDTDLVDAGARAAYNEKRYIETRCSELTDEAVEKPSKRVALMNYLNENCDMDLTDTRAATFNWYLENDHYLDPVARELMELSIKANKTSTAKYAALQPAVSPDGRFRGGLQFSGAARTRRWAGRVFQPHNLPSRGLPPTQDINAYIRALKADVHEILFDDQMRFASAALRGVLVAPPKCKLVVSDLSNIEGRLNPWLAGEAWKLDAFRAFDAGTGPDPYKVMAGLILGKPPEDIDKEERQIFGKVPELALGYAGGVGAMQTMSEAYGVNMEDHWPTIKRSVAKHVIQKAFANWQHWGEERATVDKKLWIACETIKLAWRNRHKRIVLMWDSCEKAAEMAINKPGATFSVNKKLFFSCVRHGGHSYLRIKLPSGRYLVYFDPQASERSGISYMGIDATASGGVYGQWVRVSTYGGKFIENVCQVLSRDILADNMQDVEDAGYDLVLTVHDEGITEVPDTDEYSADHLSSLIAAHKPWMAGLPLEAAGYETYRWRKE